MANMRGQKEKSEFDVVTVQTRRVTKVTKGAKKMSFSAVVVVGNRNGKVGVGLGKSRDPRSAIEKASNYAKKHMITVSLRGTTIMHQIEYKYGANKVLLKPATPGTGVIAGNSVRAVLELAGVSDVLTKMLGSNNKVGNVYCTFNALKSIKTLAHT